MNENIIYKINQQCLQNLIAIQNELLPAIETKGDSTMIMYKARLTLFSTLEQIQKDNAPVENEKTEDGIVISNKKKEDIK